MMSVVSAGTRQRVGKRDSWTCHYCFKHFAKRSRPNGTVDHVVPRSAGGSNDIRNLVWSCRDCNTQKGSMHYLDFCELIDRAPCEEVLWRQRMLQSGINFSLRGPGEVPF